MHYNIEKSFLFEKNGKKFLFIEGWAFFDNTFFTDINSNLSDLKVEFYDRIDVYEYFNKKSYSLCSGFRISGEVFSNDVILTFKNSYEDISESINFDILRDEKSHKNNIKALTIKIIAYLKHEGIKSVICRIKNYISNKKDKKSHLYNFDDIEVLPSFKFEISKMSDLKSFSNIYDKNNGLIIVCTNSESKENIESKLKDYKQLGFNELVLLFTSNIDRKYVEMLNLNCKFLYSDKKNLPNEEIFFLCKNIFDDTINYISFVYMEDKLNNNIFRYLKNSNSNIITGNELRFIKDDFFSPFYKKDLLKKDYDEDYIIKKALRKSVIVKKSFIEKYYMKKYTIKDIEFIDDFFYFYHYSDTEKTVDIKLIPYYLPQFHPIPENNKWWGDGFTEWRNVNRGTPQYEGHYQPHIPTELGYYDLLKTERIQYKQVELAKKYGIYGFCYYYYWFQGKKLLEKPIENLLSNKDIDFPFCICWANETWSKRWDGMENEILIKQVHDIESDINFINDVIPMFKDERYICIDKKPVLLIYRANLFPNLKDTIRSWDKECRKNGFRGIRVVIVQSFGIEDPRQYGSEYAAEFPPHNSYARTKEISNQLNVNKNFKGTIFDYKDVIAKAMNKENKPYTLYRGVMLAWDNTARRMTNSKIFHNSSPYEYKKWLISNIEHTILFNSKEDNIIFINAWNEWAEGTHLEPDEKNGYDYLKVTKEALNGNY